MPLAQKVAALLGALTPADVDALPPIQRRRFADLCRHVAEMAEREEKKELPKAGFFAELADGRGRE